MNNTFFRSKYYLIFYIFFFVGIAGHFSEKYFDLMITLTPFILFSLGVLVLVFSGDLRSKQFIYWFVITYLFTLLLEIIGVKTGMIFGDYTYGDVLGLKLFGVPLIIGFNWLFVIAGAFSLSCFFSSNRFAIILSAAILSVVFDMLLEPVAVKLGYWEWLDGIIPFQNYAAWFLISAVASAGLLYFKDNDDYNIIKNSKMFMHYFLAQIIFFLALNFN